MDHTTKRNAADRIRPILAAMERSIDTARRRRLHTDDVDSSASNTEQNPQQREHVSREPKVDREDELIAAPAAPTNGEHKATTEDSRNGDQDKPTIGKARLKARPKRAVNFPNTPEPPFYGAKAG